MNSSILEGQIKIEEIKPYIQKNEIYRYLSEKDSASSKSDYWRTLIDEILDECLALSKPAYTSKPFDIMTSEDKGQITILDYDHVVIKSHDLASLLGDSFQIHIVGVTLGLGLDRKIQYFMKSDATRGVILDACASVVIEACCDFVQDKIMSENLKQDRGLFHTNRFSPGYGDLELNRMKVLSDLIQMTKRIGIHVSERFLMQPQKSVLFLMGVSKMEFNEATSICEHKCVQCKLKSCQYRVGDKS